MAALTEAEFQDVITGMCDELGILWHHCDAPYRCSGDNGFPDLILVGSLVMFVELKSWFGRLKPQQNAYASRLIDAGATYAVWKPRDLYNGVIDAAMTLLAP
jgi:hypothetical protein